LTREDHSGALPLVNLGGADMQVVAEKLKRADVTAVAAAIALVGLAGIAGFLFFQYVVGLPPCPLCLEQRYAFYVAVPLAALLWLGSEYGASRKVLVAGFAVIALAMLWNSGLAVYHAGVEWKFWAGPADCSGPLNSLGGPGGLLGQIKNISVVRCDEAAWRFLGLSLAGWNVPLSLGLALLAAWGARGAWLRPKEF
jgi:disulfide bond formation protein DsbB